MAQRSIVRVLTLGLGLALVACGVPRKYRAERDHLNVALTSFGKVSEVSSANASGGVVQITPELRDTLVKLLRRGLRSADSVGDPFLAWLHPQLPTQFRENLVKAERLALQSLLTDDPAPMDRALPLMAQWEQFFRPLSAEISAKASD